MCSPSLWATRIVPGPELVAFAPGAQEREIAPVADHGGGPAGGHPLALVVGELQPERHLHAGRRGRLDRPAKLRRRLHDAEEQLGRRLSRNDVGRHPALEHADVQGGLTQQRVRRAAAAGGSARGCRAGPRWRSPLRRGTPNGPHRPVALSVTRSEPFCPTESWFSVGSPLIRNRPRGPKSAAARAPSEPFSSPTRKSSPILVSPRARSRSAAVIMAAAMPFASQLPRPCSAVASSLSGTYGGTVSTWVREDHLGAAGVGVEVVPSGGHRLAHDLVAGAAQQALEQADRRPLRAARGFQRHQGPGELEYVHERKRPAGTRHGGAPGRGKVVTPLGRPAAAARAALHAGGHPGRHASNVGEPL